MAAAFFGAGYVIYRIQKILHPEFALFGAEAFLLNPFILIESVISAHNDIVMVFFALMAVYLLVAKKPVRSFGILFVSIAIKYATILLVPAFVYVRYQDWKKKSVHWESVMFMMLGGMIVAVIAASLRTNFQPWYLLYLMPFMALLAHRRSVFIPMIVLSVTALCNYLPFLANGNWDPPIPTYLLIINTFGVILAGLAAWFGRKKINT